MANMIDEAPTKSRMVADRIEAEIKAGVLQPGARLSGMRELAARFNVSIAVINSAYDMLEAKRLIQRHARSGVHVNPKLKPQATKLAVLFTNIKRGNMESYYEPLFELSAKRRIISMAGLLGGDDWRQTVKDALTRKPDCALIDLEGGKFDLKELCGLCSEIPLCFVNRWEWAAPKPERFALVDYPKAFGEALRLLRGRGHERIAIMAFHKVMRPFLAEYLASATASAGFAPDDARLLHVDAATLREDPAEFKRRLDGFKPSAIFALSDYLLHEARTSIPELEALESVGFYNLGYSRFPGHEFSSFNISFDRVWDAAFDSFGNSNGNALIEPEFIPRWRSQTREECR